MGAKSNSGMSGCGVTPSMPLPTESFRCSVSHLFPIRFVMSPPHRTPAAAACLASAVWHWLI
jgi:hypothetical protein